VVRRNVGESIVTYTPGARLGGGCRISRCDSSGKPTATADLKMPKVMNRFLDRSASGELFLGTANYDDAPDGAFGSNRSR